MGKYLGEALSSVFAQTYLPTDVIVVDDGSTDETGAVVERWGPRIRYIRQENAGECAARNTGIRASSAKYLALLDADDVWAPDKLAPQIQRLEDDPRLGLVCSDFAIEHADGRHTPSFFATNDPPWADGDVFDGMFGGWSIASSSVVVRRAAIDQVGLFDTSLDVGGDLHLWLRIALSWKVAAVTRVLCTIKQRPGSARGVEKANGSSLRTLDRLEEALPGLSRHQRRLIRRRRALLELELGRFRVRAGRVSQGRQDLLRAVRHDPLNAKAIAWLALSVLNRDEPSGPRRP